MAFVKFNLIRFGLFLGENLSLEGSKQFRVKNVLYQYMFIKRGGGGGGGFTIYPLDHNLLFEILDRG